MRDKFDDQYCVGKAAQRLRSVKPSGDEEERDACRKAQQESENIRAPALGQRLNIVFIGSGCRQSVTPVWRS